VHLQKNFKAFAGDWHIRDEIQRLVTEYEIRTIVETGTNRGVSAVALAEMMGQSGTVCTIEVNEEVWKANQHLVEHSKILPFLGNSPDVLKQILSNVKDHILFYLDAHWHSYWPLRDELRVIAESNVCNPVICIHDCQVPGKDFGFDEYNGQILCFQYVQDLLPPIYRKGFDFHYNEVAEGDRRGVLYITPKGK